MTSVAAADHFSRCAGQYAAFRPRYPAALFDWLAAVTPAQDLVWDCACGSGQASVDLAGRFHRVIGTDLSAAQVAHAAAHERVDYRVASAEASGLPAGAFDLVTVAQALHWFDLERFYTEVRRVLRPGGVLAVWSYGVCTLPADRGDAELQHYYREVVGPYWPPERRLVEEGYRGLPFPAPELTTPALSMRLEWSLAQLLGYLRSWSATARYEQALGCDPVVDFHAAIAPRWGAPENRHPVSWPLSLRAARLAPPLSGPDAACPSPR